MTKRTLSEAEKVEPRQSKYNIDELVDLCSRKDINSNNGTDDDLIEVTLCLANEIKHLKAYITVLKQVAVKGLGLCDANGVFLALEQMIAKGKETEEELRRTK